jgi:hypothetical protein
MTIQRMESRIIKLERRGASRSQRYFFYEDETAEMAEAAARGRWYAMGPRVCATSEKWQTIWGAECNAH